MQSLDLAELIQQHASDQATYQEFLRVPALSSGLYFLPAGSQDPQQPHAEDEIYYVIRGRGAIRVGGEDRAVQPGTFVFVAAGVDHRFHSIAEDLAVLVLFAPAESTRPEGTDVTRAHV